MIAVGLAPQLYKLDHQPGWLPHSVAFNADDGKYVKMAFFRKNVIFFYVLAMMKNIAHVLNSNNVYD